MKDLNGRELLRSKTSHKPKIETICDVLNNVESDCTSEDLSPVSVLDHGQFHVDNIPTSGLSPQLQYLFHFNHNIYHAH